MTQAPGDNYLELWDSVSTTDPEFTTKVNQRGGFTAIGAQYQLKNATEVFGPFGSGFGVRNENYEPILGDTLVIYTAEFFYTYINEDGEKFANRWQIQNIIKKYSNHIPSPEYLHFEEVTTKGEGEKKKETRKQKEEQINDGTAFWKKPKGSLKKKD